MIIRAIRDERGGPTQQQAATAREKLIVALDFATSREAEALVTTLGDSVSFYKIGCSPVAAGCPLPRI